jgi:hypothetical protein
MAKKIQPQQVWLKGEEKTAEFLSVTGIYDNYASTATNICRLFTKVVDAEGNEVPGEEVSASNLDINGQDYINWGDQPAMSINAWIYDWCATKLNLVILP